MADFRKWILALSVLALVFTGVASAQGGDGGEGTNIVCCRHRRASTIKK